MAEHFDREETFMSHAHYSGLEEHKKEPREATKLIEELGLIYTTGPESIDGKKIIHFLSRWLTGHILGSDMNYVPYLTGVSEMPKDASVQETQENSTAHELESLTLQLRPEQVDAVQKFTRALAAGGRVAAALIEAVNQVATKRSAVIHGSAVKTFCKNVTAPS